MRLYTCKQLVSAVNDSKITTDELERVVNEITIRNANFDYGDFKLTTYSVKGDPFTRVLSPYCPETLEKFDITRHSMITKIKNLDLSDCVFNYEDDRYTSEKRGSFKLPLSNPCGGNGQPYKLMT
eukprot:Pgem_evm2s5138